MDLIDRYLAAIAVNLPRREADDITAELRDTLLSRQEDQEAALGRTLTTKEREAMVEAFGHPLVVAARYQTHQYLIGPRTFPFYVQITKLTVGIVIAALLVAGVLRAALSHGDPGPLALQTLSSVWTGAITAVGAVTIVFALVDRYAGRLGFMRWSPRALPIVIEPRRVRLEAISEVVAGGVCIIWWIAAWRLPHVFGVAALPGPATVIVAAWSALQWPVLALLATRVAAHALTFWRPSWRAARICANLAMVVTGLAVAAVLWRWGVALRGSIAGVPPRAWTSPQAWLGLSVFITVAIVPIVWTIQGAHRAWRLWREHSGLK